MSLRDRCCQRELSAVKLCFFWMLNIVTRLHWYNGMVQWRIIVFSDSLMTMMMATIIASEDVCMPVGVGVWEVRVCVCMCVWVYCSLASAVFLPRRASTYFNERSNRVISILIYTHISICINHWLCKGSAFPFSKELIDLIKYEDEKS